MSNIFDTEFRALAFQEKSAWVMTVALLLGGALYCQMVAGISAESGQLAQPLIPIVAVYTATLVVVSILGHVAIAVFGPKEANSNVDERDRRISDRAGHVSSYVFGVGVVLSLGFYLISHDGDVLFYSVFACLMIGQLAEYIIRIFFYRTAV